LGYSSSLTGGIALRVIGVLKLPYHKVKATTGDLIIPTVYNNCKFICKHRQAYVNTQVNRIRRKFCNDLSNPVSTRN
jgi:hypothetical protein